MVKAIVADHDDFLIINKLMLKLKNVDLSLIHFVQHIQQLLYQQTINPLVIQLHIMNTHHQHHFMMEEFLVVVHDVLEKVEHIRKFIFLLVFVFGSSDIIVVVVYFSFFYIVDQGISRRFR